MQLRKLKTLLVAATASVGIGCGSIDLPLTLALQGDNTIALDLFIFGSPTGQTVSTDLDGGVDLTLSTSLLDLFNPGGILATVTVDDVLIAGPALNILGLIDTGTICVSDVPGGGGTALLKIFQGTAAFQVTLDTVVNGLAILDLAPGGLPFTADIDDPDVPFTFADILGFLFGGGGGGGLAVGQSISTTITGDGTGGFLDLIAGTVITADLTLAQADAIPMTPEIQECVAAGF